MKTFDLIAILTALAALLSYANLRLLKLPATIGVMVLALLASTAVVVAGSVVPSVGERARSLVGQFEFGETLLQGMLGFLLFSGALHVDLGDLSRQKWPIALLATLGTLISTALVGLMTWGALAAAGMPIRPVEALLFGALISPTDPIAVLGLLKRIGAPKALEVQIAGESLFNDGVGVVLFAGLLEIATGEHAIDAGHIAGLFFREAAGGIALGLILGLATYAMLRKVDDYQVEILLTLALVTGGYALAEALHVSGPIAMVVAGLLIGNPGRSFAMSATTTRNLDLFWGLVDETLNAFLFVLLGLEILDLTLTLRGVLAGLVGIPIVLVARWLSVILAVRLLRPTGSFAPYAAKVLTWGGLRGGISVALALSIPDAVPGRDLILAITYAVVLFSVLAQGLTIGPLTKRLLARAGEAGGVPGLEEAPAAGRSGH